MTQNDGQPLFFLAVIMNSCLSVYAVRKYENSLNNGISFLLSMKGSTKGKKYTRKVSNQSVFNCMEYGLPFWIL